MRFEAFNVKLGHFQLQLIPRYCKIPQISPSKHKPPRLVFGVCPQMRIQPQQRRARSTRLICKHCELTCAVRTVHWQEWCNIYMWYSVCCSLLLLCHEFLVNAPILSKEHRQITDLRYLQFEAIENRKVQSVKFLLEGGASLRIRVSLTYCIFTVTTRTNRELEHQDGRRRRQRRWSDNTNYRRHKEHVNVWNWHVLGVVVPRVRLQLLHFIVLL